jgi:hypothetical protein
MTKPLTAFLLLILAIPAALAEQSDRLVFEPPQASDKTKHVVLISGDEEYRTEESMPMLAKILSRHHGFRCTVLFALDPTGSYIDSNNQEGLRGLEELQAADLMLIGTRFRRPSPEQAQYVTDFLNAGKPVIGIRTSTHAFNGKGQFGSIPFAKFGRHVLGEEWVSHHGGHKRQGARGVIVDEHADHPILNGVEDVFAPSDVYGVVHLSDEDQILMRAAVTETLDPKSKAIEGEKNDPMMPFAWLREYSSPDGNTTGKAFCTTGGASVDFVSEDLRRLVVNAALHLTGQDVPKEANVSFVDPFYPSFYGFIRDKNYWKEQDLQPADFGLGKTPHLPDPPGTPEWNFRPMPK